MPKSPHLPPGGVQGAVPQGSGAPNPVPSRSDTARYIEEMAGELSHLARSSNLELLAYLLDIARLEARKNTGRVSAPR